MHSVETICRKNSSSRILHLIHYTSRSTSSMSASTNSPSFFEDTTSAFNDPYSTPFVMNNKRKRDMQVCFSGDDNGHESPIF